MDECIFCAIAGKRVPTELLFENERVAAFKDIKPSAPVHYLVIPKEHIPSIAQLEEDHGAIIDELIYAGKHLAARAGLAGYKLVFNVGREGGQIVDHLHLHVLGGWQKEEGAHTAESKTGHGGASALH